MAKPCLHAARKQYQKAIESLSEESRSAVIRHGSWRLQYISSESWLAREESTLQYVREKAVAGLLYHYLLFGCKKIQKAENPIEKENDSEEVKKYHSMWNVWRRQLNVEEMEDEERRENWRYREENQKPKSINGWRKLCWKKISICEK